MHPAPAPSDSLLEQEWLRRCQALGLPVDSLGEPSLSRESFTLNRAQIADLLRWMKEDLHRNERDRVTLEQFGEGLTQAYEEINMLFRIASLLNCVADPEQLMTMVCHQLQQTLPFQWVALRFNQMQRTVPELAGRLLVSGKLPIAAEDFANESGSIANQWKHDDWVRLLEPHNHALAGLVGSEVIADPITHDNHVVGALLAGNKRGPDRDLSSAEMQFIDALAEFLGVFHENLARFAEQRALFKGTLRALTASIDAKDHYTRGHSERVALLAKQMSAALGMDKAMIEQFHIAGLVHDVGKIGVPEAVLCKPGRLNDAEFEIIKQHPRIGFEILKDIPQLQSVLLGVLHHHERWDGGGYPNGLAGEQIPLLARILAMGDAFDAMSSNRSYRPALSRAQVHAEIRHCSGSQFDPKIAALFLTLDLSEFDAMLAQQHTPFENRQAA